MYQRAHASTPDHARRPPTPASAARAQRRSAPRQKPFDPQVQAERATRLGHHFGRAQVSPPAASATATLPVQTRAAEERPSGQHLAPAGRGQSLPEAVRRKMEGAFGQDFSGVRVHEGQTAESIGAIAFTRGQDIHFAPGRYSPTSRHGQELLGHELAHVAQQRAGRVAVPQGKGAPINADSALETEADHLGKKAASADTPKAANAASVAEPGAQALDGVGPFSPSPEKGSSAPIQRFPWGRLGGHFRRAFKYGIPMLSAGLTAHHLYKKGDKVGAGLATLSGVPGPVGNLNTMKSGIYQRDPKDLLLGAGGLMGSTLIGRLGLLNNLHNIYQHTPTPVPPPYHDEYSMPSGLRHPSMTQPIKSNIDLMAEDRAQKALREMDKK